MTRQSVGLRQLSQLLPTGLTLFSSRSYIQRANMHTDTLKIIRTEKDTQIYKDTETHIPVPTGLTLFSSRSYNLQLCTQTRTLTTIQTYKKTQRHLNTNTQSCPYWYHSLFFWEPTACTHTPENTFINKLRRNQKLTKGSVSDWLHSLFFCIAHPTTCRTATKSAG